MMNVMRRIGAIALALTLSSYAAASTLDLYRALRAAGPQNDGVAVHGREIARDAARFRFDDGEIHFLAAPDGKAFGAVFVGAGSYTVTPRSPIERGQLALLTGDKELSAFSDRFQSLVMLFSDGTEKELRAGAAPASGRTGEATDAWRKFSDFERRDLKTNLDLDVLRSITDPADAGAFFAAPSGGTNASMVVAVDPAGLPRDGFSDDIDGEGAALYDADAARRGFWYLAPAGDAHPKASAAAADRYELDTRISGTEIAGETVIHFTAPGAARVIPIHLAPKLRISKAEIAAEAAAPAWQPVAFVQEKADEDADAAILLDGPVPSGRAVLRIAYQGKDVLFDAGDGNYSVRARESWYPNFGTFHDPALFELTYRCPADRQVVSVGEKASEGREGNGMVSRWKTSAPIRVAGFNYGKFKMLERADAPSGAKLAVFTNPGTPDVITEINQALRNANASTDVHGLSSPLPSDLDDPFTSVPEYVGRQSVTVDTQSLAESALVDGINTARVGAAYFGKLPAGRVAITQQSQWSFGQSWPGLIYLPYLAFLDRGVRHELGLDQTKDFVEAVGPHEFAHQWWGHLVGWANYADQWLSEGFAEFTAGLVLEKTGGPARARDFWAKEKKFILETPHGSAIANCDAGPVALGWRLSTFRNPVAANAIMYGKGAYVLKMLRTMMRDDRAKDPDGAFIAMMHDFTEKYAGKEPTTADFRHIVEAHMVPAMNATGDGKMDWFFHQWVEGTAIPRITSKIDVKSLGGGKYELTGEIAQNSVPDDFRVLVPLYLDFGKGKYGKFGVVPMIGNRTVPVKLTLDLPQKPKAVVVNALGDVLTRN